jgi:4,5-dihydroxyphthalate decarboxylase
MGEDFWSYGVQQNLREIDAVTRYAFEQGLTSRRLTAEELFVASTFDLAKV